MGPTTSSNPDNPTCFYFRVWEAFALTIIQIESWFETKFKDARINDVTNNKALQIWTEILYRFFMEIRKINTPSTTGQSTRRKQQFVTAVLAGEVDNEVALGGIFLDRPYWPEGRPIRIADVWSALLLVLSLAADCDTTVAPPDRQPDWYLELLISSGIIMRTVATAAKKSPPLVIHILWDARNHFLVQSTAPNVESEASNLPIPPILGATPPGGGIQMAHTHALMRERGVLVRDVLTEMGQVNFAEGYDVADFNHENLGKCAETLPYLSVLLRGELDQLRLFGVSIKPRFFDVDEIVQVFSKMKSDDSYRESGLRVIHEVAFIAACERCCEIVARAEWDFRQYTCREGRAFMMNTQGEEVQDD